MFTMVLLFIVVVVVAVAVLVVVLADEISWSSLVDNRDFYTLGGWEIEDRCETLTERYKASFEELVRRKYQQKNKKTFLINKF